MQQHAVFPMNPVTTDVPPLWGASWNKQNGQQKTDPTAAFTSQNRELEDLTRAHQVQIQSMMMLVHELRSPAATSKSMVATLRYLRPQDAQLDKFLAKIEARMDHLLDLVNDILDLSQAKAGDPLGQATILDLVEETATACTPYLDLAAAKELAVSVELPEHAVRVQMPERAYHLIVSNLVSNAIKYTLTGSVRVTLRQKGAYAELTVQDTGIGIPQNELCHLFTEFFRASNARAGRTPGTGLGLAAVKALVQEYHGKLALQSQENRGSRFTVQLPLYQADVPPMPRGRKRKKTLVA
ncbi:MAG TPA: HAMP domain-containing sensor histidine kinase [Anaerolineae bacterium]|nr:HAMP domain-containing sensor histidine kinase [Anaerolineae bacterium]